jgi:hypothetical protein
LVRLAHQLLNSSGASGRIQRAEEGYQITAGQFLKDRHQSLVLRNVHQPQLLREELKVFSQHGEDGIIAFIFSKIGVGNARFVEFGVQDGTECNCANLAINFGWSGLLMDGDPGNVIEARRYYQARLNSHTKAVQIAECFVTRDNINAVLTEHGFEGEIDLLSIDIDGNDYWIWKAIDAIQPRVVVIEYNASYGPERSITIPYDPNFVWMATHHEFYYGASLAALTRLAHYKGYILSGCESSGTNAFFIRKDVAEGVFDEVPVQLAYIPQYARILKGADLEGQYARIAHLEFKEV